MNHDIQTTYVDALKYGREVTCSEDSRYYNIYTLTSDSIPFYACLCGYNWKRKYTAGAI